MEGRSAFPIVAGDGDDLGRKGGTRIGFTSATEVFDTMTVQGKLLRWSDIDFERRIIHVRQTFRRQRLGSPKGGRSREVEMSEDVMVVLAAHRHARGTHVFCKPDGVHFIEGETRAPLARIAKRAGLRHIMWHVCRHSFCSHLVMAGIPLRVVQLLAGHT